MFYLQVVVLAYIEQRHTQAYILISGEVILIFLNMTMLKTSSGLQIPGSHHFVHSGQIVPLMYPRLKKHKRVCHTSVTTGSGGHLSTTQHPNQNMLTSEYDCNNIPHLDILNRGDVNVIDVETAQHAVKAVRAARSQSRDSDADARRGDVDGSRDSDADARIADVDRSRDDGSDVEMCETDCRDQRSHASSEVSRCENDFRKRLDSDLTESDSTEINQNSGDIAVRKARRRQRNKLSARAYRDRKRSKAQEQEQILANLEAEQRHLLESVRKLQEEKREFLQYLKSEMNIDMTKGESEDLNMNMSET